MEDVGINQNQFNVGQQLLSLGIVLFEIPSNMILYRVGPGKWLTLQLFLFGLVSLFQAFQKGYPAFLVTRFLLGATESGFIPGGLWTMSTWYTRDETAKRVMLFYIGRQPLFLFLLNESYLVSLENSPEMGSLESGTRLTVSVGNQFGAASSKLLAYGILYMRGVGGKPGWFWLFALMGIFTILVGCLFGLVFPDSFKKPYCPFAPGRQVFTDRELYILNTRVVLDDPLKGHKKKHIDRNAFKKAFVSLILLLSKFSARHVLARLQEHITLAAVTSD